MPPSTSHLAYRFLEGDEKLFALPSFCGPEFAPLLSPSRGCIVSRVLNGLVALENVCPPIPFANDWVLPGLGGKDRSSGGDFGPPRVHRGVAFREGDSDAVRIKLTRVNALIPGRQRSTMLSDQDPIGRENGSDTDVVLLSLTRC